MNALGFRGTCLTAIAITLVAPCFAAPAQAQSGSAAALDEQETDGVADIVVTAQKREERMQSVPVAVSAFSAASLDAKGVKSLTDLGAITPGLVIPTAGIGGSPRIRGVGTQISQGGNENSVAIYVDGVYYPSAGANVMAFNNIAQVAVLKGPQGTLFGRNATGGLLQITTRDPGQSVEANAQIGYGNLNTFYGSAYVAGPLGAGLAADIAVDYKDRQDGFGTNLFNGKEVGNSKSFSVRSKWKAALGDATNATLILDYNRLKGAFPAYRPVPGELPLTGVPFAGDKFDVNSDVQPLSNNEDYGVSLNIAHEFSGVNLVSISAYRHGDWKFAFDSESLPLPILSANGVVPDKVFSQELQLISTGSGPLNWALGVYYFNRKSGFIPAHLVAPALGFLQDFETRQDTESFAGYGQATYKVSDATALTLGLRLTSETKSYLAEGVFHNLVPRLDFPLGPTTDSEKVTKLTWRAALDHHFTKDVMVYASYNRGFKSGGYDPTSVSVASYIRPEVLDAFEVGLKSDLLDRHLRFNAAAYKYSFKDIQLNTYLNGLPAVYNGKSAKISGFDLDVTAIPVSGLSLTAGLGYVHGRFDDFSVARTALVPTGGIAQIANISADGKRLPNTPDTTVNLGAEYMVPLGSANLALAADYFHSTKWFSDPENRLAQKAYSLVNASATLSFAQDRYSVKAWGRNLGNVAYASQLFPQVPVADVVAYAEGRTFGVTLGAKF
jgi:iron complex outermembrane receptor protein